MKKILLSLSLILLVGTSHLSVRGADAPPAKAEPTMEQRVGDLEAYINNVGRFADTATNNVNSKIAAAGPGHNAWMMTSAALVLFMTLPGLALFYGGLVRRKNVLSVLAQCLGIAGLVSILWWLFGYSFVFGDEAGPVIGNFAKFAFLKGVDSAPNTITPTGCRTTFFPCIK